MVYVSCNEHLNRQVVVVIYKNPFIFGGRVKRQSDVNQETMKLEQNESSKNAMHFRRISPFTLSTTSFIKAYVKPRNRIDVV